MLSFGIFNFHFAFSVDEHLPIDADGEAMTLIPPLTQLSHSIDLVGGQRIDHRSKMQHKGINVNFASSEPHVCDANTTGWGFGS